MSVLRASEVIAALQRLMEQHGDCKVSVTTQYGVYDAVSIAYDAFDPDCAVKEFLIEGDKDEL